MAWSKELDKNLNKDKFKRQEEAKKESSAPRENAWSGAVTKNNNPNAEFEPSRKSETKGGSSSAKQQSGVKKTSPSAVLGNGTKYFRGFQSYQDRKKNGNVFTPTTVMGNAKNGKIKKGNILPNVSDDLAVKMGTLLTQYEKITNSELTVGERNSAINSLVKENRGVFESYKRETHSDLTIPSLVNMFDREAEKRVEALSKQKSVQPDLRPATLKDLTVNSFQQGFYNANYGKELYKEMSGNKNYADFYGNKLEDDKYRFEPKGLLQKAVSGASRQLGQHSVQATDPTTVSMMGGALAAALVAGNSGPQALLPEEIITGPGAVAMAYKAGSAMSNMKIEAGLAYDEMIKNGISKDTATKIALGVGGVNAALEAMQLDELAKAYTVLGKNPATQNGAKLLMNYALRAGLSLGNEVAQETAQDGVTIAGVQAANKIEKGEWAYDAKEVTGRLGDTALSSTLTFGAMGLPGHFKNLGMAAKNNYDNVSSIGRDFKNMGEVQSVIDTGIKSDKATGAYKYADKMQQKQAAGKELSDWNVGRQWNKNIRAIQSENDFAAAMSNIKPTEIVDRLYAGDTAADVRYSPIEYDKDGNAYVNIKENQGLFEGVDSNQYSKIALNFMNEKYKDKTMSLSDYNLVKADKIGIRKFVHSGKGIDINTYQAKMRASGELHNLLEAAEYIGSSDDEKNHSFAKYGFDYYKTRFIVDGQMFEGIIDIGVSESGSRFYGMTNVKRTSYSSQPSVLLPDVAAELKVGDSFNNIIYKNNGNVKRGLELNGMATSDGVKVSTNGNQSVPETIKHEWSHMFKTLDPEAYSEYEASVIEAAREANSKAVDKRMEFLMNEYGYSEEIAREEIVAELTGGFNTKAIQQMAEGNAALADNLAIAAQRAKTRIKAAFGDGKYTSSTGLQMTFEKLNQAEKMYVDGLARARNNQPQTGDVRYSPIEYDNSGNAYVRVENNVLNGVPRNQWSKAVSKWLNQNIQGREFTAQSDSDVIKTNRQLTREYARGRNSQSIFDTNEYDAKMNLVGNIDEAITISDKEYSALDNRNADGTLKHGNFAKSGWDYRTFNFEYNGKRYVGKLNIAKNDNGHIAYDVTNIKEVKTPYYGKSLKSEDTRIDALTSNNSISDNDKNVKYSVKENTDKLSQLYENTMQKDAFGDEFKSEAERRKPEFMYEGITNKATYAAAQSDIARRGDSEILSELSMKNGGWTAEDTAKSLALMAQYQSEGNAEKAVDVASMLREKMTNAGQAVQALKIVNRLTPEGQFIDFMRQADGMVDKQIEKHPASEKIRKEIKEAQKKDKITEGHTPEQLRVMREYENAVDGDMRGFIERVRSGENTKYEYKIAPTNDRFNKETKSKTGINTDGFTHYFDPNAIQHIDKRHGILGEHDYSMKDDRDIQRIGYVLENFDNLYKSEEKSTKFKNSDNSPAQKIVLTKRIDGHYVVAEAIPDSQSKRVHVISAYKIKADEVPHDFYKSLGLTSKNELHPASTEPLAREYGDISVVPVNAAGSNTGATEQQALIMQAEKSAPPVDVRNVDADVASTNTVSQDGGNVKTEYEKVLDKYGIEYLSESELKNTSDTLKQLSELNDKDDLINLILKQSKERKTASHALVKKALEGQEITFLKDTAMMQIFGKITDKMPVTFAQKASTYQAMSHLLNARTMARNITSNAMFNTVDRISADIGSITDSIMGIFTGRRTVGVDRGVFEKGRFKASANRAAQQYLDIALAVNHETDGSKYNLNSARRTFKGRAGGLERAMSYGLQVTDEWSKGGIEHNVRKSLERLKNCGFTEEEINSIAKYEARYRTFQDDTKLSQVLKGLKDTLNVIGIGETKQLGRLKSHEFGLGDLVQKYTQVPGALITRSIEYSPLGYCKALYHIGQAANNARKGADFSAQAQRNIALSLGRAMTGTGLIALFAGLSRLGIFTGEREDEDEKLKAMENAEGVSNTQLNLSALGRLITDGEADGRQNGDVLTSLGFLEPLNTLMAMGNAIAEQGSVKNPVDWAKAAGAKTFDQIMDMSTMSTIRSISNTLQYGGGGTDVAIGVIADSATGFVPSPVRQLGGFLDTVQRNPYNEEDNLARAKERFKATLPWAREDVAAKINPYGEEKTTSSGNRALDFLNNFFSPGSVNIYQTSDISEELYRLAETSADVLPHVPAKSFTVDKVKFKPRGKDYEKYSRLVGTITAQKMRDIINDDDYSGMSDEEKIEALSTAAAEGEKEAKEQYAAGKADDMSAPHFRMTEPATLKKKQEEIKEKNERQEKITGQLQAVSDAAAAAVPDKADNYSLKSLQINSIQSVKIDGKSYDLSDEIEDKVISAANEEHYSNIEKLMNNEINIEDIVGYTSKGKARTTTQADGTKVSLTGKMYNDDGTSRFDEIATARIIYHSKEAAKEHAAEKYRNEITGTASQPAKADEPVKVSKGTGGGGRQTTSAKALGRNASGGGFKGKSSGGLGKVTFTARAGAGSAATAKRSRTRSVASLPNSVDPQVIQRAVNSFMKNNKVNTIKPLENPLFM